jgi:primosomal protein N' (replication factor Y)
MVKKSVKKVIDEFSEEKADILIGTQMIAKGHDFKNVSLVGIILADLGLNVPSYRASERTFSLLTQALGRAGRQKNNALAIIQTYMPNHYVIYDASLQDYNRFYMEEMRMRKMQQNPPYTYLTLLTFQAKEEKDVIDGAYYYKNLLSAKFANLKVDVIGPSEPFLAKLNNKYRRKILLKYKKYDDVAPILEEIKENVNKNSSLDVIINVDPSEDY